MAQYPRVPTGNNKQYTLDSQISAGASSLTLNQSVAGVVRAPGYLVVDRIDSSGNLTPTKREYKYFTGVSGANITGITNSDGTDQVHAVGAIVEFVPNVGDENDKYSVFVTEHTDLGTHASLMSLNTVRSINLINLSTASLQGVNTNILTTATGLFASGASVLINTLNPVWVLPQIVSLATTGIGVPLSMPNSGYIQWASVALTGPVSGASLLIDINKNGTSIFDAGTRLSILGGGTFASTASIATRTFAPGNIFTADVDNVGNKVDAVVQFHSV